MYVTLKEHEKERIQNFGEELVEKYPLGRPSGWTFNVIHFPRNYITYAIYITVLHYVYICY